MRSTSFLIAFLTAHVDPLNVAVDGLDLFPPTSHY